MTELIDTILKDLDDNIKFWRESNKECKHYYVDAYCCVKHNILQRMEEELKDNVNV